VHLTPELLRVKTLAELDALVGTHVTLEKPEVYWEDSHGYFQFHSEVEARQALRDPYYQRFLPDVDWAKTVIREVRVYRNYASNPAANWAAADRAIAQFGPMTVWRETGNWLATFGSFPKGEARHPMVAICLAALIAGGVQMEIDHDSLDSDLQHATAQPPKQRK
jgi:hypothetical protein